MHTTMSKKEFHGKIEERGSLRLDHDCSARPLKGVCVRTIWYAWEYRSEKRLFDVLLDDWAMKRLLCIGGARWVKWLFLHWCMVGYRVISYERCWDIRKELISFSEYGRWAIGTEAALLSTVYLIQSTVLSKSNPIAKTTSVLWWFLRLIIATEPYLSQYIVTKDLFLVLANITL